MTPWTPAPPGGDGWQRPFPRAMLSLFSSSATAPFFRSVKPEGLPPPGGNKPGGLPPPGVLYCLQPAARPLPAAGGQSAGPGGPGGDPLDPAPPGGRGWQRPFPRAWGLLFCARHGPLFPQRKAGGPSALRRQQARWPSATGRPLLLAARRKSPCPPQRAGSPPVQGVTPWPPWRGRGRFLRLRRSRTCPRAGSAQSGSRHW